MFVTFRHRSEEVNQLQMLVFSYLLIRSDADLVLSNLYAFLAARDGDGVTGAVDARHRDLGGGGALQVLQALAQLA